MRVFSLFLLIQTCDFIYKRESLLWKLPSSIQMDNSLVIHPYNFLGTLLSDLPRVIQDLNLALSDSKPNFCPLNSFLPLQVVTSAKKHGQVLGQLIMVGSHQLGAWAQACQTGQGMQSHSSIFLFNLTQQLLLLPFSNYNQINTTLFFWKGFAKQASCQAQC